jgi:hypothetical protein
VMAFTDATNIALVVIGICSSMWLQGAQAHGEVRMPHLSRIMCHTMPHCVTGRALLGGRSWKCPVRSGICCYQLLPSHVSIHLALTHLPTLHSPHYMLAARHSHP